MTTNSIPQTQENITIFHKSAIAYAKIFNWPVFPLVPNTKEPILDGGFHRATTNIEQINQWWLYYPDANLGVPTGKTSGLIVLDIDPRNGGDESLEMLINDYGELPETVMALTPGGGQHYYFKYDDRIAKSKLPGYEGLDLQGNGKYVVLPPSIHPNGKPYEWELSSRPDEVPIAELPEWIIQLTKREAEGEKKPVSHWEDTLRGIGEGGRNNAAASLSGHLLRRGIHPVVAYELITCWNERNDPPIEAEELDKTFNSILAKETERLRGRNNGD